MAQALEGFEDFNTRARHQMLTLAGALGYERRDIAALHEVLAHLTSEPHAAQPA
jgi:hypothetical protein